MKATQGNRRSSRLPTLFAAVAGIALSASGCFIESSTPPVDSDLDGIDDAYDLCPLQPEDYNGFQDGDGCPDGTCSPDLTINWRIFRNNSSVALTCGQSGNADTVTALIDGGAFGTTVNSFTGPCPTNASAGSFVALLPATGSYNVSLELSSGPTVLSETNILVQPVDCSGTSSTPPADLFVNF